MKTKYYVPPIFSANNVYISEVSIIRETVRGVYLVEFVTENKGEALVDDRHLYEDKLTAIEVLTRNVLDFHDEIDNILQSVILKNT